jgi:hypothetical protein
MHVQANQEINSSTLHHHPAPRREAQCRPQKFRYTPHIYLIHSVRCHMRREAGKQGKAIGSVTNSSGGLCLEMSWPMLGRRRRTKIEQGTATKQDIERSDQP